MAAAAAAMAAVFSPLERQRAEEEGGGELSVMCPNKVKVCDSLYQSRVPA